MALQGMGELGSSGSISQICLVLIADTCIEVIIIYVNYHREKLVLVTKNDYLCGRHERGNEAIYS